MILSTQHCVFCLKSGNTSDLVQVAPRKLKSLQRFLSRDTDEISQEWDRMIDATSSILFLCDECSTTLNRFIRFYTALIADELRVLDSVKEIRRLMEGTDHGATGDDFIGPWRKALINKCHEKFKGKFSSEAKVAIRRMRFFAMNPSMIGVKVDVRSSQQQRSQPEVEAPAAPAGRKSDNKVLEDCIPPPAPSSSTVTATKSMETYQNQPSSIKPKLCIPRTGRQVLDECDFIHRTNNVVTNMFNGKLQRRYLYECTKCNKKVAHRAVHLKQSHAELYHQLRKAEGPPKQYNIPDKVIPLTKTTDSLEMKSKPGKPRVVARRPGVKSWVRRECPFIQQTNSKMTFGKLSKQTRFLYNCTKCKVKVTSRSYHLKIKHPDEFRKIFGENAPVKSLKKGGARVKCDKCSLTFKTQKGYLIHLSWKHGNGRGRELEEKGQFKQILDFVDTFHDKDLPTPSEVSTDTETIPSPTGSEINSNPSKLEPATSRPSPFRTRKSTQTSPGESDTSNKSTPKSADAETSSPSSETKKVPSSEKLFKSLPRCIRWTGRKVSVGRVKTSRNLLHCKKCDKHFPCSVLAQHMKTHTAAYVTNERTTRGRKSKDFLQAPEISDQSVTCISIKCDQCTLSFDTRRGYMKHVSLRHAKRQEDVKEPPKKILKMEPVTDNSLSSPKDPSLSEEEEEPIKAEKAEPQRTSKDFEHVPIPSKGGKGRVHCDLCPSTFVRSEMYRTHRACLHCPEYFKEYRKASTSDPLFSSVVDLAICQLRGEAAAKSNRQNALRCTFCYKVKTQNSAYWKSHVVRKHGKEVGMKLEQLQDDPCVMEELARRFRAKSQDEGI